MRASQAQIANPLPSGAVILGLRDGVYYTVNEVGALLWNLLQQPRTIQELQAAVVAEFRVSPERCAQDVSAFVDKLMAAQLIERVDDRAD